MFKSKHSGWTFELKRTPFGGGGGSWNPVNIVSDAVSSVSDALASVDPGPAIGSALASVDKTVGDVVPGGWGTIAALAAAIATAGTSIPESEAMFMAQDAANLASQGLSQEAIAQNLAISYNISAADAATAAAATNAGAAETFAQTGSLPIQEPPAPTTSVPGADQVLAQPDVNVNLGSNLPSGASNGMTAPLSGSGAVPGAGATTLPGGGLTGALPANVMVGDGTLGTTMGATYMAAAPGQFAVDASGAAIPASSVGIGGFAPTASPSISTSDVNNASKLAKALTSQAGSQLSSATQSLAQGANQQGMALPNLVRGNQSPFAYTAQQPIRDAQPMDLSSLANLLKQG